MEKVESGELPIGGSESLDPSDAYLEEVFLKLRILEGVPASWFDAGRYEPYVQSGLLVDDLGRLIPRNEGCCC
jgi:coproporphyrinogen III oxidase-like Fe-S oxidoreductase